MSIITMPVIETLRPNFTRLSFGKLVVWYSYKTPIAFKLHGMPIVIRENEWGVTSGKHFNALDGGEKEAKAARVDSAGFETRWAMMADKVVEQGINLLV